MCVGRLVATPQICLNMQQKKPQKNKKENLRTDESRREKPPVPAAQRQSLVAVKSQGAQSRRIKVCVKLIW